MKKNVVFIIIIMIAAVLRLWQIGVVPPSPDWDEVSLGYNAYSILKTGRDEYGTWFPVSLRSYDDYKPPLYMYLAVPAVALFGLETWVVRLPSAIMGILAVAGTYYLVKMLIDENKDVAALLSSGLLAISPWHIQFSRIAFEANTGVTLNVWGFVCFLKGLKQRSWMAASAVFFGLSLYAYHSERLFVPLLLIVLVMLYRKELWEVRRTLFIPLIIGLLVLTPLVPVFFNSSTLTRLRGTSSLADQTGLLARSVQKLTDDNESGNPWGVVFDNRRVVWAKTIVDGYLSHFSIKWLFLTGDNPRHHAPDMGLLYIVELPFLLYGFFTIGRTWNKRSSKLLISWILIAPIAASPTTELPHAIRTLVFLPSLQIITAIGLLTYIPKIKNSFVFLFLFTLFLLNFVYYLHMYFGHTNAEVSQYWQYGYKEAVSYAKEHYGTYKKIVVSTELEQPHMFFLYFLRYDPKKYLAEGGTRSGGFEEVRNKFDIFEFRPIHWDQEARNGSELYIGTPKDVGGTALHTISYLDGSEAIRIAER